MLKQLGDLSLKDFLQNYWQKKPVIIRGALPDWESPLFPDELAGLALEEDVESRLIIENDNGKPWQLRAGPFSEEDFNTLPETGWTLLVQAVDHWVPEVTALLDEFRFLPSWRLDDVMVSYAPDGGSVGPHFDHYDVFLVQGFGKRLWQIGARCDESTPRLSDTPLNILQQFEATEEYLLEPGDVLYVPPQFAHWGIADGECMTYSVGFRAPSHAEILDDFTAEVCKTLPESLRFQDVSLVPNTNSHAIDPSAIATISQALQDHLQNPSAIATWFGKYMTEPKYDPTQPVDGLAAQDREEALEALQEHTLSLYQAPDARFAYYGSTLFVNGNAYTSDDSILRTLCAGREISNWRSLLTDNNATEILTTLVATGALWFDDPLTAEDDNG